MIMNKAFVSIIIPVYNARLYLDRTMESIASQVFKDFEVVLVDDGSSDGSDVICDDYAKASNINVVHKRNEGASFARRDGIKVSRGDWIFFLDADDWIEKNCLSELVNACENGIDIVTGNYVIDTGEEEIIRFKNSTKIVLESKDAMVQMFEENYYNWSGCGKLYRKELFDEYDYANSPRNYGDDTYMNWLLFKKANKVCFVPNSGYHYCTNIGSLTNSGFNLGYFDYFDVWEKIANYALTNGDLALHKSLVCAMLRSGLGYLLLAEKQYDVYRQRIMHCLKIIEDSIKQGDYNYEEYMEKCGILTLYKHINVSYYEYMGRYERVRKIVKRSLLGYGDVYLYGTGAVAKDIIDSYNLSCAEFSGFVVTKKGLKDSTFLNRPVYQLNEVLEKHNDIVLLLAMNKQNSEQVANKLDVKKQKYICLGQYSYLFL